MRARTQSRSLMSATLVISMGAKLGGLSNALLIW